MGKEYMMCSECDDMLSEVYEKYAELKSMFVSLSSCVPDMIWAKDLDGVYTYANNRVAYQLYRTTTRDMIGNTDVELASNCKEVQGSDGFTFGQMCGDSDKEVLKAQKSMKFLERGLIDGEELILMVHKNVERNIHGDVVGTVGVGRDVTHDYHQLEKIRDETTDMSSKNAIITLLSQNYYKNPDEGK